MMATEAADSSGHHSAAARIRWRFSSASRRATRSPAAARGCYANSQRPLYDRGQRCNAGRRGGFLMIVCNEGAAAMLIPRGSWARSAQNHAYPNERDWG